MPNRPVKASQNALKTGVYARETLLKWESVEEYKEHVRKIVDNYRPVGPIEREHTMNIVDNRWLRKRLRQTTAISTHLHPLGRELEESGARTWQEALSYLQERGVEFEKVLESIAASNLQLVESVAKSTKESEGLSEILEECKMVHKTLERIATAFHAGRELFAEYSPKQLERRIRIENSLDAQYDKLRARLLIEQEARALHDKLRQETAGTTVEPPRDNVDKVVSDGINKESPTSDEPKVRDPLEEFIRENDEVNLDADNDELDLDADDDDDWGEPKPKG